MRNSIKSCRFRHSYLLAPSLLTNNSPTSVTPNGTIYTVLKPSSLKMELLAPYQRVIVAACRTVALGVVGRAFSVATTGAQWSEDWVLPALWSASNAAGRQIAKESQAPPTLQVPLANSVEEWNRAVESTRQSIAGNSAADIRVFPPQIVSQPLTNTSYQLATA